MSHKVLISIGVVIIALLLANLYAPQITGAVADEDHELRKLTISAPVSVPVKEGDWLVQSPEGIAVFDGTFTIGGSRRLLGYASRSVDGNKRTRVGIVVQSVEHLKVTAGDYTIGSLLMLTPDGTGHAILTPGIVRPVGEAAETKHVNEGETLLVYLNLPSTRYDN